MSRAEAEEYIRSRISDHCVEIRDMFKYDCARYVTVIVRPPGLPEQEVIVTDDPEPEALIETIRRRFELSPPTATATTPSAHDLEQALRAVIETARPAFPRSPFRKALDDARRLLGIEVPGASRS